MKSRDLILDVLVALGAGICRVGNVSVQIHGVPDEVEDDRGRLRPGKWRDGHVNIERLPEDGRGRGEECPWPTMTDAEALREAADLIEYFAPHRSAERVAAARALLAAAKGAE
jgi:hypothetical protein